MNHFIALCWSPRDTTKAVEAARLCASLQNPDCDLRAMTSCNGLAVYARAADDPAMRSYVLSGSHGIVFGRLFRTAAGDRPVDASELDAEAIISTAGRPLTQEYWGSYVAILRSKETETTVIIRDCSGRVPCYYVNLSGIYVFFSDIRDLRPLRLRFTINTHYVTAYILHHPLHTRQTGLREVSELLAGDRVVITRSGADQQFLWSPGPIAASDILDSYSRAMSELVSVTEDVIRLWASTYHRILLNLSGGLDSAIVLGCLSRLGLADRVICVNRYMEGTGGDERQYARAAAQLAGVQLFELPRICDAKRFAENLQRAPASPTPDFETGKRMMVLDGTNELADHYGCDTAWTAQGGDHVFLQVHNPYSAADYLMRGSFPFGFLPILYDSAVLSSRSVWSVLFLAIRYSCWQRSGLPDPFDNSGISLLTQSATRDVSGEYVAPFPREVARSLPPGKRTQVDFIFDLLNRHKPIADVECPYECHPLISQPLLELSLRIPTYLLLKGGRQRAMAREAFADRVPDCILRREDKGGVRDQVRVLLRGSMKLLRENLLEGILVSLGVIDRSALERIVVSGDTYRPNQEFPLLGCIAAELWAEQWVSQAVPAYRGND